MRRKPTRVVTLHPINVPPTDRWELINPTKQRAECATTYRPSQRGFCEESEIPQAVQHKACDRCSLSSFCDPETEIPCWCHEKIARRYTHLVDDRTRAVIKTHREGRSSSLKKELVWPIRRVTGRR